MTVWTLKHFSLRKICGTATRIGQKLKLERTPLYRIVSKTFYALEIGYQSALIRLQIEKTKAAKG